MRYSAVLTLFLTVFASGALGQPIKVATTNSDLYAITRELGGSLVQVENLLPSTQEPHSMPLRPSLISKVRDCRVLITIGLDHEPWLLDAINAAGNPRVAVGSPGYVDCSRGVRLLQVPVGQIDRSRGDLHVFGNTHYWLDPANIRIMSVHVMKALQAELPAQAQNIRARETAFLANLDAHIAQWRAKLARLRGTKIVTYHLSFPYLAEFGRFDIVGTVEVKPGIEPTAAHLAQLREIMKRDKVKFIVMEPWYNQNRARSLAADVGARVIVVYPSTPEGQTVAQHLGHVIDTLLSGMGR
jgi:zinc/manganese transport system substrate-binding protein